MYIKVMADHFAFSCEESTCCWSYSLAYMNNTELRHALVFFSATKQLLTSWNMLQNESKIFFQTKAVANDQFQIYRAIFKKISS